MKKDFIEKHQELQVYQQAFDAAMQVFEQSQELPEQEQTILVLPLLHASRLVCIYIAQSWGRRNHHDAFIGLLCRAKAKAMETQVWIEFAILCAYVGPEPGQELFQIYNQVLSGLDRLLLHAEGWTS